MDDDLKFEVREEDKELPKKRKSNGKNSPVIGDNGINTKPGDNSKYARILLDISSWKKPDRTNIQEMEDRLQEYLEYCYCNDVKVGNQMCYLALGIDKDTVYDWENGRSFGREHSEFIKKIKIICSGTRELLMQDGKVNPITGIFWQKNYDGLKDVQEIDIRAKQPLGEELSPDEIAKRIPQNIPIDVEFSEE